MLKPEQFPNDLYAEENMLFCKFYLHSVEIFRVDTFDKKAFRKVISTETEDNYNFVEMYSSMGWFCSWFFTNVYFDIPLPKIDKMRLFLLKHCKEGSAIPSFNCVRQFHLPKLFALHFAVLKAKLANQSVSIITDETTIMTIVFWMWLQAFVGSFFFFDVVTLREYNHQTKSGMYPSCHSCGYCCHCNRFCSLL